MGTSVEEKCAEANGARCYFCRSPDIQVHFIDGNPENRNTPNLLPVCRKHHQAIHDRDPDYREWWEQYFPPAQRHACRPK